MHRKKLPFRDSSDDIPGVFSTSLLFGFFGSSSFAAGPDFRLRGALGGPSFSARTPATVTAELEPTPNVLELVIHFVPQVPSAVGKNTLEVNYSRENSHQIPESLFCLSSGGTYPAGFPCPPQPHHSQSSES